MWWLCGGRWRWCWLYGGGGFQKSTLQNEEEGDEGGGIGGCVCDVVTFNQEKNEFGKLQIMSLKVEKKKRVYQSFRVPLNEQTNES
jgi:hypothetical protein